MTDQVPHAAADSADAAGPKPPRSLARFVRDLLLIFLVALLISFAVKTFLVRSFYIPSVSMSTTLIQQDRVIVNQLVPDLVPLNHGDVVVFTDPNNWLSGTDTAPASGLSAAVSAALGFVGLGTGNDDHLIKRVIGLPGDTVACCTASGQLTVNGVPMNEPYIVIAPGMSNAAPQPFEVTVPEDSLWVMGDNRYQSGDSAYHRNEPGGGFVPMSNLVGRAFVISWPFSRWTVLDNYPDTFADVE